MSLSAFSEWAPAPWGLQADAGKQPGDQLPPTAASSAGRTSRRYCAARPRTLPQPPEVSRSSTSSLKLRAPIRGADVSGSSRTDSPCCSQSTGAAMVLVSSRPGAKRLLVLRRRRVPGRRQPWEPTGPFRTGDKGGSGSLLGNGRRRRGHRWLRRPGTFIEGEDQEQGDDDQTRADENAWDLKREPPDPGRSPRGSSGNLWQG